MGSYVQQREIVRQLGLKDNEQWRGDCLFCGGENTLAARKEFGKLFWRCYRASCAAAGSAREDIYSDELIKIFIKPEDQEDEFKFQMPDYWVTPTASDEALDWMEKHGCDDAYLAGTAQMRYDPKENRLVFLCMKGDVCYDATGRALDTGRKPKWLRYGISNATFFCKHSPFAGRTDGIILVEDAASACAASRVMDSVGILGTHFSKNSIADLMHYKVVYIALDPDAKGKAYTLHSLIDQYRPTKVVDTKDDLKYFDTSEIEEMIEETNAGTIKKIS